MTTSTPPAWHWLNECEVPVQAYQWMISKTPSEMCRSYEDDLSIHSRKPPDSDVLREQNDNPDPAYQDCWPSERYPSDQNANGEQGLPSAPIPSDQCPECRCAPNTPHATGCGWPTHLTDSVTNAASEHAESRVSDGSREHPAARCPVCLREMESDEGILCDHCEEPTGVESFAVVNGPGGVFLYHLACYDEVYWGWTKDWPGVEDVEDCPACAALHVLHGGGLIPKRETAAVEETFDVPFPVQSWTFEALIETEVDHLHEIIDDHHDEIVKMARRRHRTGHVLHGSKGYQWDAQTRLRNVLEELSDGGTYLTMGPIE